MVKLVVHCDINSTIMLADKSKGLDMLANLKRKVKYFVEDEAQHEATVNTLYSKLAWPEGVPVVPELAEEVEDDGQKRHLYRLFPSFFKLLVHFKSTGQDFSLVFRTFGVDFPHVAEAMAAFAAGKHPLFPTDSFDASDLTLTKDHAYRTQWQGDELALERNGEVIEGTDKIFDFFSNLPTISAVIDSYTAWSSHNFHELKGKPLFLCPSTTNTHHVFFDDNILAEEGSCVALYVRPTPDAPFQPTLQAACDRVHERILYHVNPLDAILDDDYFIKKVHGSLRLLEQQGPQGAASPREPSKPSGAGAAQ